MYVNSLDFRSSNTGNNNNARIDYVLDKAETADGGIGTGVAKKLSSERVTCAHVTMEMLFAQGPPVESVCSLLRLRFML